MRPTQRPLLQTQQLEDRAVPAVLATFLTDVLTVTGDANPNDINVSADANGNLVVTNNGQNVPIRVVSGMATKMNVVTINVDARGGDDRITLDRSLNVLDADGRLAYMANGNLMGGSGNDFIQSLAGGFQGGVVGNPILGNNVMDGGSGNDTINSGFGNDIMLGGSGNDTLVWLPGTLLDVYEGGDGNDNAVIVGNDNNQGDAFVLSQHPTDAGRVLFQRTNLVPFFVDIAGCETVTMRTQSGNDTVTINDLGGTEVRRVVVDAGIGDDVVNASALTTAGIRTILNGGDGNDLITGSANADVLDGGNGNDTIFGGAGRDTLFGGAGDDNLDGGLGADQLFGNDGNDTLTGGQDGAADSLLGGAGSDIFISVSAADVFQDMCPNAGDMIRV